jgi:murein DD-endopeptidase MepM/ murein hydrolase activator NlpD
LAQPGTTTQRTAQAGGAEYGSALRRLPGRPRVRVLRLSSSRVTPGSNARLVLDVRRRAARSVRVRVAVTRRGRVRARQLRRVRAGRVTRVRLPRLRAGSYRVRVTVLAGAGERPLTPRTLRLTVRRKPRPAPRRTPRAPAPTPQPVAQPPAPAPSGTGVFPVQGSYSFGGRGSRFGAGRTGHTHEGHDIAAREGVPVVAPLAGEILFNDYQANGAGRYVVLHADNGWDMMFAHLRAGSAVLDPGTRVAPGQQIGVVGSTGGSEGPHLHFELWPSGWRHLKGTRPIDPLPQLRAWAG